METNQTPWIDAATELKDNSARLVRNRENQRETYHGLTKVLDRLVWIAEMTNFFAAQPKPWTDQVKQDYQTFLVNKNEDLIVQKLREHVNNLGFQYRGLIGVSNELDRISRKVMNLAAPEFQKLASRTVNVSGLGDHVTKPSPEEAAEAELARAESLDQGKLDPNLSGPTI